MKPQAESVRDRFDCEGEEIARHFLSEENLRMSPEEYAARNAHNWGLYSLDRYRYQDPTLEAWVRRVGAILHDPDELERCRQRFLNPEEIAHLKSLGPEDF